MKNIPELTELDFVVMEVLWSSSREMTIQEITSCLKERELSTASVAQVMRRLLKKKAAEQVSSVLVSNVYARTFRACVSREEILSARVRKMESKMSSMGLAAAILKYASEDEKIEEKEIEELQQLINARKEKTKRKKGE